MPPWSMIVVAPGDGRPMWSTRATSWSSTSQRTTPAARLYATVTFAWSPGVRQTGWNTDEKAS